MLDGLIVLPVWGYVLVVLALTHLTIIGVTVYLHRCQAHRALDLHPAVSHFLRFWLWLTTGMVTKEWVAVHRKHHAKVETPEDPHSPQIQGIRRILLEGTEAYREATADKALIEKYGHGCPDDWIERNLYQRTTKGYVLMLAIDLILFGPIGLTMWAVQMLWIPFLAAGVINGLGHWWGYRNFETADSSTNIFPIGILIGGEELHNNHHAFGSSAKLSSKWWEFDAGWMYIQMLRALGLARVKKLAPKPVIAPDKVNADRDTVTAIAANRLQVMAQYAKCVLKRVHEEELAKARGSWERSLLKRVKSLLVREESLLSTEAREVIDVALGKSQALETVYQYKRRLQAIWQERSASHDRLLAALQQWCREAEETGIRALQEFARTLPSYTVARV